MYKSLISSIFEVLSSSKDEVLNLLIEGIKDDRVPGEIIQIVDNLIQNKKALYIDDTLYEWKEIEPILRKLREESFPEE